MQHLPLRSLTKFPIIRFIQKLPLQKNKMIWILLSMYNMDVGQMVNSIILEFEQFHALFKCSLLLGNSSFHSPS